MPRPLDVGGLFAFVAPTEKQYTRVIQHGVIQPISRTRIDSQFMQFVPERSTVSEISGSHPSDPDRVFCPRAKILQSIQPLAHNIFACPSDIAPDFNHRSSVTYKSQIVSLEYGNAAAFGTTPAGWKGAWRYWQCLLICLSICQTSNFDKP